MSEHGEDKDHGLWSQSEPSEKKSGKNPCGVCQTGVGRNAVFCGGCVSWILESKAPSVVILISAVLALGKARPINGRLVKEVLVDDACSAMTVQSCAGSVISMRMMK